MGFGKSSEKKVKSNKCTYIKKLDLKQSNFISQGIRKNNINKVNRRKLHIKIRVKMNATEIREK